MLSILCGLQTDIVVGALVKSVGFVALYQDVEHSPQQSATGCQKCLSPAALYKRSRPEAC